MSETTSEAEPGHHDLKTIQPFYDDVASGRKTFECRVNDRAFQAGDTVVPLGEYVVFSLQPIREGSSDD